MNNHIRFTNNLNLANVVAIVFITILIMPFSAFGEKTQSTTNLIEALRIEDLNIVKELLASKVDVNAKSNDGLTPLVVASFSPFRFYWYRSNLPVSVLHSLIAAGANVNDRVNCDLEFNERHYITTEYYNKVICNRATALLIASSGGELEVVKALLVAGADVNILGGLGMYWERIGCHHAPCSSHPDLYDKSKIKSEITMEAANLKTPLMAASQKGHVEIVKALLAAKADVNIKSSKGETALMMAQQHDHEEIVRLLESAGAKK